MLFIILSIHLSLFIAYYTTHKFYLVFKMANPATALLLLAMVLASTSLLNHHQNVSVSAQDYLNSLNSTHQMFQAQLSRLSVQVSELSTLMSNPSTSTVQKITTVAKKISDEKSVLGDIQQFLKAPYSLRVCSALNYSKTTIENLTPKVAVLTNSTNSLQVSLSQCPADKCPNRKSLEDQLASFKNYLGSVKAALSANCSGMDSRFAEEKAVGVVDVTKSIYIDNLKATNWFYGNITEVQYKLKMFTVLTKFNVTACPIESPYANRQLNKCISCSEEQAVFNLGTRVCLKCSKMQMLNRTTSICMPCPPNSIYSSASKQCEGCPSDQFLNTSSMSCEYCPSHSYFNKSSNSCLACPARTEYNKQNRTCMACNVTAALYYNDTTRKCQACPSGLAYLGNTCTLCANNSVYDSARGVCNLCQSPQYLDMGAMRCAICDNNKLYNDTLKKCVQCPKLSRLDSVVQKCIPYSQICQTESQPVYNPILNRCQTCPSTQIYHPQLNQCLTIGNNLGLCPSDKPFYNIKLAGCEACPAGTAFNAKMYKCMAVAHSHRHQLWG